jgi:hypothetical protein
VSIFACLFIATIWRFVYHYGSLIGLIVQDVIVLFHEKKCVRVSPTVLLGIHQNLALLLTTILNWYSMIVVWSDHFLGFLFAHLTQKVYSATPTFQKDMLQ